MGARHFIKQVGNLLNLSTLLGVLAGLLGRASFAWGPRGLILATGYKLKFPIAGAFTLGNVVLTKHPSGFFDDRPVLLVHEERHSWQWFWLFGLPMLPLYGLAAIWSWLRTGDPASRNPFERLAGLGDGNYLERPVQPLTTTLAQSFNLMKRT